jgi:hypothetical protein
MLMPALARAGSPSGWFLAGSDPYSYVNTIDPNVRHEGAPSARLASAEATKGFGTMMQAFDAADYTGKRLQLSGWVKAEAVTGWAGLWMRVDDASTPAKVLTFDNMQTRPIKGTLGWKHYNVVLDIPVAAKSVSMGILLDGQGTVWVSDLKVEVVPSTVPVTGLFMGTTRKPTNLDFSY